MGNEHVVYYDETQEKVVKITCPPNFGAKGRPDRDRGSCRKFLSQSKH